MCARKPKTESSIGIGSGVGGALFPKIRRKALALFLLNPEKQYYFREAVRLLGDTPGSLHRELKSLTAAGILSVEQIGMQKFYRANPESPVFSELKSIAEKTFGIADVLRDVLRTEAEAKIDVAWIYGSVASGQDTSSSDIDLMVIGTLSFRELVAILKPVEEHMQRPINPTLYSESEFQKKVQDGNHFLLNVLKSDKLFVVGDENDLARLAQ
jgi:predicted nucleotidyltransferase